MEGSVLSFLKAEWKVSDTGSSQCWASSLSSIINLNGPNCAWVIIDWFVWIENSRWLSMQYRLTWDPMGNIFENYYMWNHWINSQKLCGRRALTVIIPDWLNPWIWVDHYRCMQTLTLVVGIWVKIHVSSIKLVVRMSMTLTI